MPLANNYGLKLYGEALAESIKKKMQRTQEAIDERQRHIDDCRYDLDDCFLSHHIDCDTISECKKQLKILEGDGTMEIEAVFDENGKEVNVRWVHTRYGGAYVGRGIFASSKEALLKKTGWTTKTIKVPCWTKFCTNGTGMAGVCSGSTQIVRWHTNMKTGEYVGYPD